MTPDQILPIALIVVMLAVAVILIMVGIQLFLLIKETRVTVRSVNSLVQNVDSKVDVIINPIRTLGSLATGVAGGLRVFESFSNWLKNRNGNKN